ncbi:hypothetical protein [Nocardia rhamnosiphila]
MTNVLLSTRFASLEMYPAMPATEISTASTRERTQSRSEARVVWPEPSPLDEWWNRVMGAAKAGVR